MTGRSHDLVSAATAFAVAQALHLEPEQQVMLVFGAFVTARLPDIDVHLPMDHRGATHSLLAGACVVLAVAVGVSFVAPAWMWVAGGAVGVGYATHLLADAMTLSGVPLGAPFVKRDVHLLPAGFRIRTGSPVELVFQAVVVLALASLVLTSKIDLVS